MAAQEHNAKDCVGVKRQVKPLNLEKKQKNSFQLVSLYHTKEAEDKATLERKFTAKMASEERKLVAQAK